jgi:stress-induced morphogen
VSPEELKAVLVRAFPDAEVEIEDLTGTKDHYRARIVSKVFEGKGRIEQHRMVYAALGEAMKGQVHAFTFATYTPAGWHQAQN